MTPVNAPIPSIAQASENAARLLQQALAAIVQDAGQASVLPSDLELARSNTKALAFVDGVGLHGAYRYIRDKVATAAVPGLSVGKYLDGWLDTYKMPRKQASVASGVAAGSGVNGSVLDAGTLMQHEATGWQFRTTASATVVGSVLSAPIVATQVGLRGNLPAGTQLKLVSTVVGVDSVFTVAAGTAGGADVETDEEALFRLKQRLSSPPRGGSPSDYAGWALSRPGITRAWGIRNPVGPTSAGVVIMADGNAPYGLPTEAQQDDVFDYIADPRRGPPDELFVIIPVAQPLNPTIRIRQDTPATRAAVVEALTDLYFRESVPGGQIPHSHLFEAVSSAQGENDHQFASPALTSGASLVASSYAHLLVLGTVSFEAWP